MSENEKQYWARRIQERDIQLLDRTRIRELASGIENAVRRGRDTRGLENKYANSTNSDITNGSIKYSKDLEIAIFFMKRY